MKNRVIITASTFSERSSVIRVRRRNDNHPKRQLHLNSITQERKLHYTSSDLSAASTMDMLNHHDNLCDGRIGNNQQVPNSLQIDTPATQTVRSGDRDNAIEVSHAQNPSSHGQNPSLAQEVHTLAQDFEEDDDPSFSMIGDNHPDCFSPILDEIRSEPKKECSCPLQQISTSILESK